MSGERLCSGNVRFYQFCVFPFLLNCPFLFLLLLPGHFQASVQSLRTLLNHQCNDKESVYALFGNCLQQVCAYRCCWCLIQLKGKRGIIIWLCALMAVATTKRRLFVCTWSIAFLRKVNSPPSWQTSRINWWFASEWVTAKQRTNSQTFCAIGAVV